MQPTSAFASSLEAIHTRARLTPRFRPQDASRLLGGRHRSQGATRQNGFDAFVVPALTTSALVWAWQRSGHRQHRTRAHASAAAAAGELEIPALLRGATLWAELGVQPTWETSSLELCRFPGRGLGWKARRGIKEGELLLTVPLQNVLVAPFGDESEAELAAALLQVLGQGPRFDGAPGQEPVDEMWSKYTNAAFPKEPAAAALTWSAEEIEALEWPPVVEMFKEFSAHLHASAERVAKYTGASLKQGRWAVNAVVSRSFSVDGLGRALVPFADFFNDRPLAPATWSHRRAKNPNYPFTAWSLAAGGQHLNVQAMEAFEASEEVTISYGEETNAEMLAVHGYMPTSNEADYITLFTSPAELVEGVAHIAGTTHALESRLARLEAAQNAEAPLAVRPGGITASVHLVSCVEAVLATDTDFEDFHEVFSPGAGHAILASRSMPVEQRLELRKQAVAVLQRIVFGALQHMSPPDKDHEELCKAGPTTKQGLAAAFRLSVKQRLLDFLEQQVQTSDLET